VEHDLACSSRAAIGDTNGGNCLRPWPVLAEPGDREGAHARQSLEYLHLRSLLLAARSMGSWTRTGSSTSSGAGASVAGECDAGWTRCPAPTPDQRLRSLILRCASSVPITSERLAHAGSARSTTIHAAPTVRNSPGTHGSVCLDEIGGRSAPLDRDVLKRQQARTASGGIRTPGPLLGKPTEDTSPIRVVLIGRILTKRVQSI